MQWERIEELFPSPKSPGKPPTDWRKAFDAILWILRTGSPWRDLPEEIGKRGTIYDLYDRWNGDGTLHAVLNKIRFVRIDGGATDSEL
ncbi:transposase [Pirellula sp. SH-Sr6A]|uniref:transposase n=1 Tax=Pirellula sp. SH-Sr6A TaxID=1632865 RepID=UPI000AA7BCBA